MKKILFAITAIVLCSCAPSLRIANDFDRNADFRGIRTFGIYQVSADARTIGELNSNRVYNAIRTAMMERGFRESPNPDIWINAVATVRSSRSVSSTTTGNQWQTGGRYRPYRWGPSIYRTQYHVTTIREGVLIIDIIDARSGHLIWQSVGRRNIDRRFRDNREQRINQYVREMLSNFPPR